MRPHVLAHYEILEELGRGGMGVVYRARDTKLQREVALKVLPSALVADEERRRRFLFEARAAAAIEHPHVAVVYEVGEADDAMFIAMEFVRGETLGVRVHHRALTLSQALELAIEIGRALDRAHLRGVVHRDLKPGNIMIDAEGHAKLIDFGLAKRVLTASAPGDGSQITMTEPGRVMGTVAFMSPEQGRGLEVDHRSDIFSFGANLYFLLVGQAPFFGESMADTLSAILRDPAPRLPDLMTGLTPRATDLIQQVIDKCLAKDPGERYQRMDDIVADLEHVRQVLGPDSVAGRSMPAAEGLAVACPRCGSASVSSQTCCQSCGHELTAAPGLPSARDIASSGSRDKDPSSLLRIAGERKVVTVLCAEVADLARLAGELDDEVLHSVLTRALRLMSATVERYQGTVDQARGHGLVALFGAPRALEDHATRAVYAALSLQETLRGFSEELKSKEGCELPIRVGVHSGPIVITREDDGSETIVANRTSSLAMGMQAAAEPGATLVSDQTRRLVEGYVDLESLGSVQNDWAPKPVSAYVLKGRRSRTRFEVSAARGLTPLVGRQHEFALLRDCLARVESGQSQVVGVAGAAGSGKSRLVHEFRLWSASHQTRWLEGRCATHATAAPYAPILEIVRQVLDIEDGDHRLQKSEKLRRGVEALGPGLAPIAPFLSELLGLSADEESLRRLGPQVRRARTFEAIRALLAGQARLGPLVMLIEDLHWIDRTSEDFLLHFIQRLAGVHILILTTYRSGYEVRWAGQSYCKQLSLDSLTGTESAEMIARVLGTADFPGNLKDLVGSKAEGVPLFVEEILRSLIDGGRLVVEGGVARWAGTAAVEVPATVHDIIRARIDQLDRPVKNTVQAAAVIGREFRFDLLKQITGSGPELERLLGALVQVELVYESGVFPELLFTFKHAVIQDVAYGSMLESSRRHLHGEVAQAIERADVERQMALAATIEKAGSHEPEEAVQATQPELLAHHFTEAGVLDKAVGYWQQAARHAVERSANVEAIGHLTRGLELLGTMADSEARTSRMLKLQVALGAPLIAAKGYAAQEVEDAFDRARRLCHEVGETSQLFRVLWGLAAFYLIRADLPTARELAQESLACAERQGDEGQLLEAHSWLGTIRFYVGEMAAARDHFDQALALYDRERHGTHGFDYGLDPAILCKVHRTWMLWLGGHPAQAMTNAEETLALARALAHPLSLAHALNFGAVHHQFRSEPALTQESVRQETAVSMEHQFPHYLAYATILGGWARVARGDPRGGIQQMHDGLAARRATGAELARPYFLTLLAAAYRQDGQAAAALRVLEEATAVITRTEERWWEPEVYRLTGEVLAERPSGGAAEADVDAESERLLRRAVELARAHSSTSLELRAAVSLVRLTKSRPGTSDPAGARRLLVRALDAVDDKSESPEAREAAALLAVG